MSMAARAFLTRMLADCEGARTCGEVAEVVEAAATFVPTTSTRVRDYAVLRIHVQLDSDDVSNDHVLFVAGSRGSVVVLDAYVGAHAPQVTVRPGAWLRRVLALPRRPCDWNLVFGVSEALSGAVVEIDLAEAVV